MCVQAGLAAKVDKASRKLRKERKNRSKKVCTSIHFFATRVFSFSSSFFIVPQFRGTKKVKAAEPPKKGK